MSIDINAALSILAKTECKAYFPTSDTKVYVGLSGGVDSAVAALLMKMLGYNVIGVFLRCWDSKEVGCTSDEDEKDAAKIASMLGIKFETRDYIKEYKKLVFNRFISIYRGGNIPNPDILCNSEVKFGIFAKDIQERSPKVCIVTGHYARVRRCGTRVYLSVPKDRQKDQTYFLCAVNQHILRNTMFPLGEFSKSEVRNMARSANLPVWDKADSKGICFIGNINVRDFILNHTKLSPGKIVDSKGRVIGEHKGLGCYSIGQRHDLYLYNYSSRPRYVIGKQMDKNLLIVGEKKDAYVFSFTVKPFISRMSKEDKMSMHSLKVRIRNLGELVKCTLSLSSQSYDVSNVNCALDFNYQTRDKEVFVSVQKPLFGVTPGQYAVFYKNDIVVAHGTISSIGAK